MRCSILEKYFYLKINIISLCKAQAIVKRKLTARKLERIIPIITEIYYSLGCKVEFIAKNQFEKLKK
jgi:hypothetical protein